MFLHMVFRASRFGGYDTKKVFREWVQVSARDEKLWSQLLKEGVEFVS